MFSSQLKIIKDALNGLFDGVYDSFEKLNMSEHLNETLCFVGISGYKLGEPVSDFSGFGIAEAKVSFSVNVLASRCMTAYELANHIDNLAVPVVRLSSLNILSITRKNCIYSKEHSRYSVSFDVEVMCQTESTYIPKMQVAIDTTSYGFFTQGEVVRGVKTYNLGTLQGTLISGKMRDEPAVITLKAEVTAADGTLAYSAFSLKRGSVQTVTVDSVVYDNMLLDTVEYMTKDSKAYITLKFTEVSV